MSDIFLSYKSEDRPRAKIIAEALERHEYSVWWDRIIPPGKTFDQVIEEALCSAKCVIVLWSRGSVLSDWVKEEAAEGLQRRILIPGLIDDVEIPLGFRRIQAARLIGWQGQLPNPEFDLLAKSVAAIIGRMPKTEVQKPSINVLNISAQELYDEGKYSKAIDKWKEVLDLDPQNKTAIEGINNSWLRIEELREKERREREKAEEIKKRNEEKKKRIIELSSDAQGLFEKKRYEEAIAKWQEVLKLDAENSEAIEGIEEAEKRKKINELNSSAKELYDEEKYREAINKWIEVLNLDPDNKIAKEGIEKSNWIFKELEDLIAKAGIEKEKIKSKEVKRNCPSCGHPNESGLKYCTQCGAKLTSETKNEELDRIKKANDIKLFKKYCNVCGNPNTRGLKYCTKCGADLLGS